ncbi:MAG TPA: hypothetical protein VMW88_03145 [Thermoplasmata archaeon]|nr:hypothetical protein [Thermoplasmata archaeon]
MKTAKCPRCKKAELVPIDGCPGYYKCQGGCPGAYQKIPLGGRAG